MKINKVGAGTSASTGVTSMPKELRAILDDLTINEALAKGKINDLGTETGVFAVPHKDPNIDAWYAIVQGHAVPMSKRACEMAQEGTLTDDVIGNMKFQSGTSNVEGDGFNKTWFRLGLGGTLNLDLESEDAVSIGAVPADHK